MWKQKIGICIGKKTTTPTVDILPLLKQIGFDAVSPAYRQDEDMTQIVQTARDCGLFVESIHAPERKAADLWSSDASIREEALTQLLQILRFCGQHKIPTVVCHVWIGYDYVFDANCLNFEAYDKMVDTAEEQGVQIAFENTEGEEYLSALMTRYANRPCVGFCWDSGHEMCYNHSQDMLAQYGDRLLITHLNDNLGISRFDGKIYSIDDLHLLPYDGVGDWDDIIARLRKLRKLEYLNFEMRVNPKPNRHENDIYARMTPEEYFTEAYKRACKVAYRYAR